MNFASFYTLMAERNGFVSACKFENILQKFEGKKQQYIQGKKLDNISINHIWGKNLSLPLFQNNKKKRKN